MTTRPKRDASDSGGRDRGIDLGKFIQEQRRIAELSVRKLSERAGISNPYLSQIERGLRKPSASILQQIAAALEISAESLYTKAGILDENVAPRTDVISAIRADRSLDERNKQTLIHLYRSLRTPEDERANDESRDDAEATDADSAERRAVT